MKMTVTGIFLLLIGIIYTEAKDVHVDVYLVGCTATDGDDMYGMDGEEMAHVDWKTKTFVMTLPEFADQFKYVEGGYENAVAMQQVCKSDLAMDIKINKNPPKTKDPPMSSIYPRDEVRVGIENTLICHVTGFYPPRLNVTWTRNDKKVVLGTTFSQMRPNNDNTFNMFSTLEFTPQEGDMYTCTVEHEALERSLTREWDVEKVAEPSVGPSVFCGVGLTLGLLGVATGTFFLVKGNQCN